MALIEELVVAVAAASSGLETAELEIWICEVGDPAAEDEVAELVGRMAGQAKAKGEAPIANKRTFALIVRKFSLDYQKDRSFQDRISF